MPQYRVLTVDDELLQCKIVDQQLKNLGFLSETAHSGAEALEALEARDFDVVLLDVQMPGLSGLETLPLIKKLEDAPEVIMLTLDNSLESGISAMRSGAYDYLIKPASKNALEVVIKKAAEKRRLTRQNFTLRDFVKDKLVQSDTAVSPVQESAAMKELMGQAEAVARLNSTVLITGESGTGKDVLARYIHGRSQRADATMISINCGAMPETLFEAEFFGYEKGAFTGAVNAKRGLMEMADGSTLFLDEIGEMPLTLQVKLLRFLESGQFRRVGSVRDLYANVRLIAATNRDLPRAISENRFRSDLFYRLNVIELHLLPLRERPADLTALIDHFLRFYRTQFGKPKLRLSDEARRKLLGYDYPGNIRELKNIIERAAALTVDDTVESAQIFFQKQVSVVNKEISPTDEGSGDSSLSAEHKFEFLTGNNSIVKLEDLERRYILSVLSFVKGNRERAADLLGISERTLYRRLREYE